MPKIKRTRAQHARQSPKAESKVKSGGNAINCRIKIDVLFSAATRFPPLFTEISHFGFCCFSLHLLLCKTCMEIAKFFLVFSVSPNTNKRNRAESCSWVWENSLGLRINGDILNSRISPSLDSYLTWKVQELTLDYKWIYSSFYWYCLKCSFLVYLSSDKCIILLIPFKI